MKNLPKKTNKTTIKEFFHPVECKSIRKPKKVKSMAYVGFLTEAERRQALFKDKSFLSEFICFYNY